MRDEGGHSLVVVDTVKPLVDAWNLFIDGLSELGSDTVRTSHLSHCACLTLGKGGSVICRS